MMGISAKPSEFIRKEVKNALIIILIMIIIVIAIIIRIVIIAILLPAILPLVVAVARVPAAHAQDAHLIIIVII